MLGILASATNISGEGVRTYWVKIIKDFIGFSFLDLGHAIVGRLLQTKPAEFKSGECRTTGLQYVMDPQGYVNSNTQEGVYDEPKFCCTRALHYWQHWYMFPQNQCPRNLRTCAAHP